MDYILNKTCVLNSLIFAATTEIKCWAFVFRQHLVGLLHSTLEKKAERYYAANVFGVFSSQADKRQLLKTDIGSVIFRRVSFGTTHNLSLWFVKFFFALLK